MKIPSSEKLKDITAEKFQDIAFLKKHREAIAKHLKDEALLGYSTVYSFRNCSHLEVLGIINQLVYELKAKGLIVNKVLDKNGYYQLYIFWGD